MTKPVSHVMPEEVSKMLESCNWCNDGHPQGFHFQNLIVGASTHIKSAYAKIAELEEYKDQIEDATKASMDERCDASEKHCTCVPLLRSKVGKLRCKIADLESQLSTLKAQMKEVIMRGDDVAQYANQRGSAFESWKAATAALRQSGQGTTE